MKISIDSSGFFSKTEQKIRRLSSMNFYRSLERFGADGVRALSEATPTESGVTARSWDYEIIRKGRHVGITWTNTHRENGFPVAIMLQYGYATGTGGYVQGRDYINPAIKPIFDRIADAIRTEVTRP